MVGNDILLVGALSIQFVMCIMFILLAIITFVCYYNIPPLNEQTEDDQERQDSPVARGKRGSEQERENFTAGESGGRHADVTEKDGKLQRFRIRREMNSRATKGADISEETFSKLEGNMQIHLEF